MELNDEDKEILEGYVKNGNNHQIYFCKHLLDKNISINQLEKWTNLSRVTIFNGGGKYFRAKNNIQYAFSRTFIRKLYFACDIDCEEFLVGKDIEKQTIKTAVEKKIHNWIRKKQEKGENLIEKDIEEQRIKFKENEQLNWFTRDYWIKIRDYKPHYSLKQVYPFSNDPESNDTILQEAYDEIARHFRENARFEIAVYELLFKGNNHNPGKLPDYVKAQNKIFNAIKIVLKHHKKNGTKFLYKRTFSLARLADIFPKNPENEEDLKRALVAEVSPATLFHIFECLNSGYSDFCEFYVTTASRFRHHATIDINKWFYSEDYMVGPKGVIMPECAYINDIRRNSPIDELVESYKRRTNNQISYKLKKIDIDYYLQEAIDYVEEQMEIRKEPLEWISGKFNDEGNMPKNILRLINRETSASLKLERILKDLNDKQTFLKIKKTESLGT